MKRITKAEDAYEFRGAVVAFTPKSYYYGNSKGSIFNNGVVFAKMDIRQVAWNTEEKALSLYLFQIVGAGGGHIPLTAHYLEIYEEGYFDMRFATPKEIKSLKDLVVWNEIELAHIDKIHTLDILNNILIFVPKSLTHISPIGLKIVDDYVTYIKVYENKELKPTNLIGENLIDFL
nr:hypothetical protein [Rickettsia endosymbiont of Ceutorhynchus assimilis]